jgi:hypothetical protein
MTVQTLNVAVLCGKIPVHSNKWGKKQEIYHIYEYIHHISQNEWTLLYQQHSNAFIVLNLNYIEN